MRAMVLKKIGGPLEWTDLTDRQPGTAEIRLKVAACGVWRTDLHVGRQSHAAERHRFSAIGIVTQTTRYPLEQAHQALADLRAGRFEGAAVLVP
jgi:D-arabinose 1-dehydrogenase-like Zn-dependent alcohol dehydrogenase